MNYAVILAGGKGLRFGKDRPKQFVKINQKEIMLHTIDKFETNENIHEIIIVANQDWVEYTEDMISRVNLNKVSKIILGGKTRQHSSYNAISYLSKKGVNPGDIVLIHDSVRPFVTNEIINKSIETARRHGACCVAVKSTDTVVIEANNVIEEIPPREKIYNEQTPQGFKFGLIRSAIEKAKKVDFANITDDVSFAHKYGHKVRLVEGDYKNIKITTPIDIYLAEKILRDTTT